MYESKSIIERWLSESNDDKACEIIGNVGGIQGEDISEYEKLILTYNKWIAPWIIEWVKETHYCEIEQVFVMSEEELSVLAEKAKICLNPQF